MNIVESLIKLGETLRLDGWFNPFTGFGTGRDKTQYSDFQGNFRLPDQTLADLYNYDDVARKVVSLPARQMFREGYNLSCRTPGCAEKVTARFDDLDFYTKFQDGVIWGRLFGGGVLFIGADDGGKAEEQLDVNRIRAVNFIDVFDRRRVWPWQYYDDPRHPKFGKPSVYSLQSLSGGITYVHDSRLIVFRGAHTDDYTRKQLNGWDFSVLQNCHEAIQHFHECFQASRLMMTDASQGVFRMKGLLGMIAGGQQNQLTARAQMLDMGRSVARSIFLDADSNESFEKVATQFAGVGDQLTQAAKRLSAATGIPVMILMGETPSGLNASGDANIRTWYDEIKSDQFKTVIPHLRRVAELVAIAEGYPAEQFTIEPKPLWQETPKEQADRRKTVAETDQIYLQNEVFTPEQVARNRFRPDGWSAETTISPEELAQVPDTPEQTVQVPPGPPQ